MPKPSERVTYVEFVTNEVDATRRALESVHGWRFDAPAQDLGGAVVAALPDGSRVAIRDRMQPEENLVTRAYVLVEDIDAAAARAEAAGALVALPPMAVGKHGRVCIFFLGGVEHAMWEAP